MEVALKVAQVAQQQRKHSEVSIYKEPGSEVYYYRAQVHGRRFKRSTGKTNYKEALVQAKVIARELRHDGQARTTMKRPGYATVGDVLAVWMARSTAETRANNRSTLRKWVRSFVAGDPDGVAMTRLTPEAFESICGLGRARRRAGLRRGARSGRCLPSSRCGGIGRRGWSCRICRSFGWCGRRWRPASSGCGGIGRWGRRRWRGWIGGRSGCGARGRRSVGGSGRCMC